MNKSSRGVQKRLAKSITSTYAVCLLGATVCMLASCTGPIEFLGSPSVDAGPSIHWTGRAIAVAAEPWHGLQGAMAAVSQTGGLFLEKGAAGTWLPAAFTGTNPLFTVQDVAYAPTGNGDFNLVITAAADLHHQPVGGIWLYRGGVSVRRPVNARPLSGPRCSAQTSAYHIGTDLWRHRTYVGTDCGYAWSDDGGRTWSYNVVARGLPTNAAKTQDRIVDIAASAGHVYALGAPGLYYSSNDGSTWHGSSTSGDLTQWLSQTKATLRSALSRLAVSPEDPNDALLTILVPINDAKNKAELYQTADGGASWTLIYSRAVPPGKPMPFVGVTPWDYRHPRQPGGYPYFTLYWGDGPHLFRTRLGDLRPGRRPGISWQHVAVDHTDIRDIAFGGPDMRPVLLATDGGLDVTSDNGAHWQIPRNGFYLNGVGLLTGYNGLQLYDVRGQFRYSDRHYDHTDLYITTQDNNFWYSVDEGRTWMEDPSKQPEGGILRPPRHSDESVAIGGRSEERKTYITGYRCGPCFTILAKQHFAGLRRWHDAGNDKKSQPIYLYGNHFIQLDNDGSGDLYIYQTPDSGHHWTKTKDLGTDPYGWVKLSYVRSGDPWLTYAVMVPGSNPDGSQPLALRTVSHAGGSGGNPRLFDASSGLGSLGIRGWEWEWTAVFGVDPKNANYIIAPDVNSGQMKYSTDGGQTWTSDTALTNVLTDNGVFDLYRPNPDPTKAFGSLLVTDISFLPENPNQILIGTRNAGIVHSNDGGLTWHKIPDTEVIPNISSFFWDYPHGQVFVSSYGRGLWVLHFSKQAFDRVPDHVRLILPRVTARATIHVRSSATGARLTVRGASGRTGVVSSTSGLTISGAGFEYSPSQIYPVNVKLGGKVIAKAYPDSKGTFHAGIRIVLGQGSYVLTATQRTQQRKISGISSFSVVAGGSDSSGDGGDSTPQHK